GGGIDHRARGVDDLDAREGGDRGAGGDDHVPRGDRVLADLDGMRVLEAGVALEPGDLVLLEQEGDAAGELLDRVEALAVHRLEVELGADLDAELGHRAAGRGFEILGGVEHRLGRDAADVEAGAAERLAAFDARGLEPELRGANGGDVSAGAGTDDEDVVVVFSHRSRSLLNSSPLVGRWQPRQRLTEGAILRALRLRRAPSTTLRVVPLPASGEDFQSTSRSASASDP